jgi:outer membrane protein TolC
MFRPLVLLFVIAAVVCASPAAAQAPASAPPAAQGPTLELSMEQAVSMALETNLGLKADRLGTDIAAQGIAAARAAFRPVFRSSFNQSTSKQLPQNFLETDVTVLSTGQRFFNSSIEQSLPWYGGQYSVAWSGNRFSTSSEFSSFNPRLGSTLALSFTQPLLQNFRIDNSRYQLQFAERTRQIADLTLERQITLTTSTVQLAYLNLIGAIQQLNVANQNMDLAQRELSNFRRRVEVGVSADIEIIQAEAEVARNEEQVVLAEADIDQAQDNLRALILDSTRADYWQIALVPSDTITAVPRDIDVQAAVSNAMANRLDLLALRREQEITDLRVRLDENLIKPQVDATVEYLARGTGGTQLIFGEGGFPPPIIARNQRGFGSVLNDAFLGTYPQWTAGVQFSYPLGQSAVKANLARTRLVQRQQDLTLENLQLQVATQVRSAARNVQTGLQRVQATQKAREASERQLDAEQRKFGVGLSSSFELQQRQRDLAAARVRELAAMIAYNQALIQFERVQRIPAGGGF